MDAGYGPFGAVLDAALQSTPAAVPLASVPAITSGSSLTDEEKRAQNLLRLKKAQESRKCRLCGKIAAAKCTFGVCRTCCFEVEKNSCRIHNPEVTGYTGGRSIKTFNKRQKAAEAEAKAQAAEAKAQAAATAAPTGESIPDQTAVGGGGTGSPGAPSASTLASPPSTPTAAGPSLGPPGDNMLVALEGAPPEGKVRDLRRVLSDYQQRTAELQSWRLSVYERIREYDEHRLEDSLQRYTTNSALLRDILLPVNADVLFEEQQYDILEVQAALRAFADVHGDKAAFEEVVEGDTEAEGHQLQNNQTEECNGGGPDEAVPLLARAGSSGAGGVEESRDASRWLSVAPEANPVLTTEAHHTGDEQQGRASGGLKRRGVDQEGNYPGEHGVLRVPRELPPVECDSHMDQAVGGATLLGKIDSTEDHELLDVDVMLEADPTKRFCRRLDGDFTQELKYMRTLE